MLDAEELDISFGQSDSLTHRLNTLILEYADGFAIPKELVQNADDAGATEVSLLICQFFLFILVVDLYDYKLLVNTDTSSNVNKKYF